MERRFQLSDEAWTAIETRLGRPAARVERTAVEAIVWKLSTGAAWRDLPARYGPWHSMAERYRIWVGDGTWGRVEAALVSSPADLVGEDDWSTRWLPRQADAGPVDEASGLAARTGPAGEAGAP
ncbi:transposase [Streptomyces sp. NPDC102278]|uniref:transposase n=1 Tax=Streptomyces sp. NPDC102278 TaxID=3366152 RepID=UPI00381B0343